MTTDVQRQAAIETVEINKTIDIAAPIEIAFEAMLEELGPEAQMMDGTPMPFQTGSLARRPLVSRSGQQYGPSVGARAGDQAADAARNLRADDDVVSRGESHSISLHRPGERHASGVRASRHGIHSARSSSRACPRAGTIGSTRSRSRAERNSAQRKK